ncbi:Uma2 family endonuclease [Thermocatellispora tengchongensis]|uniref:Uma2 family endonuclease n=1 Tax=Thermocatellispora tengchongensis TaxID=1073253 RepID=A0A840NVK7_9ACTN|nr:Uma2 family endonuclease [Thermocatellispora tengchongensis]MBB5132824.1 Uma2 family endonuclease [Thermocatellispora tengchongensis]
MAIEPQSEPDQGAGGMSLHLPGRPPYTVTDLLEFPDDGNRYELANGSLLVSPSPTPIRQRALARLLRVLDDAAPPELEALPDVNLAVSQRDFYIPDVVVVPTEATSATELMFKPADLHLAVEIVSPSTKARDRILKVGAYAAAGIPLYWRLELTEGHSLYVYELEDGEYTPPVCYEGGKVAELVRPFPVSFDPADLT